MSQYNFFLNERNDDPGYHSQKTTGNITVTEIKEGQILLYYFSEETKKKIFFDNSKLQGQTQCIPGKYNRFEFQKLKFKYSNQLSNCNISGMD